MGIPARARGGRGANVNFDVYKITRRSRRRGSTVEASPGVMLELSRSLDAPDALAGSDEDVSYTAADLDRNVVAIDQIRLIVCTFRDRVLCVKFPQAHRGSQDADLRQRRQPRQEHRAHRS